MKILCILIVLAILLGAMVAGGPGDEAARDRAEAEKIRQESADASAERRARIQSESGASEAQAYAVMQQADALGTAVAVNAENQQLAQRAMATSAAVANQYAAHTLQPPRNGGGIDLVSLAPWAAMFVTLGLSGLSVALSLIGARRQTRIIYVADGSGDAPALLASRQLYLRPLPPGQVCRAKLLARGDDGDSTCEM